ncbi:MAG TPA: HAD family phosphatase [Gammaproteobacteria bacterium]|nr:HAD family phosphatase [Gammaproteobacteria bacterium]
MIKNIIFDLGGVIININYQLTIEAFRQLGASNVDNLISCIQQDELIDKFDVGAISPDDFRAQLMKKFNISVDKENFDRAWNAMILDLPKERLELIRKLRQRYRVFLFSNINYIHLDLASSICQKYGFNSLDEYFDKVYYSCVIGHRKPNSEGFQLILSENNLVFEETIFVDDSKQHVEGAKRIGLQAIHVHEGLSILDVFKSY